MSNYNPGIEPVPSDELPPDFPLPAVPDQAEGAPQYFHCVHPDSVFSRTVCPEPCGMMHTYCATCGSCLDLCPHGPLTAAEPGEESTAPRVCSKCGTAGCLEDRESGWYEDDDPPSEDVRVDYNAAVPELAAAEAWAQEYAAKPEKERHREVRAILAEIERLRGALPEVECPSCGITIRARMADADDELGARLPPFKRLSGSRVDHDCEFRRLARHVSRRLGVLLRPDGLYDAAASERELDRVIRLAAASSGPAATPEPEDVRRVEGVEQTGRTYWQAQAQLHMDAYAEAVRQRESAIRERDAAMAKVDRLRAECDRVDAKTGFGFRPNLGTDEIRQFLARGVPTSMTRNLGFDNDNDNAEQPPTDQFVAGWQAARRYFGWESSDGQEHFAECDTAQSRGSYRCTCQPDEWFPGGSGSAGVVPQ